MSFNNALKKVLGLGDYGEGVDDLEYFEKRVYDDPWHMMKRNPEPIRTQLPKVMKILPMGNRLLSRPNLPTLVWNCPGRKWT